MKRNIRQEYVFPTAASNRKCMHQINYVNTGHRNTRWGRGRSGSQNLCDPCIHGSDESDQSQRSYLRYRLVQMCLEHFFLLFKTLTLFIYFVCHCILGARGGHVGLRNATIGVREQHSGISFLLPPFGPKDQTHVFRLHGACLYPPRRLADPRSVKFMSAASTTKSCVVLQSAERTQALLHSHLPSLFRTRCNSHRWSKWANVLTFCGTL